MDGSFASLSGAASTATSVASSVFSSLPPPPGLSGLFASCNAPPSPPAAVSAEGKATFWNMPGETFRYSVTSDKLETAVTLESRRSRQKWECRVDDARMRQCGPNSVELPRHVIANFLVEKLKEPQDGPHRLLLQAEGSSMSLALTLVFGAMFAPTYTLPLDPCSLSREDLLQAQVHDLQEELDELRKEMAELRQLVKANAASKPPPVQQANAKTFTFSKTETRPAADAGANSTLNAKAAEFVFGQPPPRSTSEPSSAATSTFPFQQTYDHSSQPASSDFFP